MKVLMSSSRTLIFVPQCQSLRNYIKSVDERHPCVYSGGLHYFLFTNEGYLSHKEQMEIISGCTFEEEVVKNHELGYSQYYSLDLLKIIEQVV